MSYFKLEGFGHVGMEPVGWNMPITRVMAGLGAADFDPASVCDDLAKSPTNNAAGARYAEAVKAKLNSLGYKAGEGVEAAAGNVSWGPKAAGALKAWRADNKRDGGFFPTCSDIEALAGSGKMSMGMMVGVGAVAIAAVAALALVAKRKRAHGFAG